MCFFFFFFKQKTAYEMRISDWSSDVCSSDLVFRMLVTAGPEGLMAGIIAERADVPPSTMSHHLATLERVGLVQSERESRSIHYRADYDGMGRLITFLMKDCCQGAPDMCADIFANISCNG